MSATAIKTNPKLDLVLERVVDVSRERVWAAWTKPGHIKKWFTPAPWTTVACEIDLRPGGIFQTVMRSPEGENFPTAGCYLEEMGFYDGWGTTLDQLVALAKTV